MIVKCKWENNLLPTVDACQIYNFMMELTQSKEKI